MAADETYLRFTHIYEYDARVTADIVTISSRAEGWLVEMPALEGTRVEAGQVVARIDDRIAKLKVDAFKAQIEASGPSGRGCRPNAQLSREPGRCARCGRARPASRCARRRGRR